jgi:hypothetical protein
MLGISTLPSLAIDSRLWDISVPHLAKLKIACAQPISSYRSCLDTNAAEPDGVVEARCGGLMKGLWECSERVMKEIEEKEAGILSKFV